MTDEKSRYVVREEVYPTSPPRTAAWVVWDREQKVIARDTNGMEFIFPPDERDKGERIASNLNIGRLRRPV